jgi:hypothetical protein
VRGIFGVLDKSKQGHAPGACPCSH